VVALTVVGPVGLSVAPASSGRYVHHRMRNLGATMVLALAALAGCGSCGSDTAPAEQGHVPEPGESDDRTISIMDVLPLCDIDHRGLLFDLGSGALRGRIAHAVEMPAGIVASDHDGASWARIYDRKLKVSFFWPQVAPLFVSLRGIGKDASRVTVSLDGYELGTLKLRRNSIKVATTRTSSQPVDAGLHELTIRFRGRKRADAEPFAELDWVRIGTPDDLKRTYGAPTMSDVLAPAAQLAGVPHRALSLRAPGAIRCTFRVPPDGQLRTAVGMRGQGDARAAIVIRRDGEEATVIKRVDVRGGADAEWTSVEVPLQSYASQVVTVELTALKTTGTGRLMFGDPAVHAPLLKHRPVPAARAAVVVVLDGVERSDLPPWRDTKTPHLPNLNRLAKSATVFSNHRAPSSLVSAALASLITGLPPRNHALVDDGARLPASVRTIASIAREGSVRAAMFTGVPTTFDSFGFGGHWERFTAYPPNEGRLASAPMDDAASWLTESDDKARGGRPMLAVVHARGGHPPWELTPDEARTLPPADYTGYFGPRRAAQIVAKLQGRHSRLSGQDAERMRALFLAGLSRQDEALGNLIGKLEESQRWDSTLFIVTGDVASARATLFRDGLDPSEALLTLPLYVHFPEGVHGGRTITDPTEYFDLTQTMLLSLGLKKRSEMLGRDLHAMASSGVEDVEHIRVATTGDQYSARWGDFVLRGKSGARPRLCLLTADPTCAYDRRHTYPMVTQALSRRLAARTSGKPPAREPLTLDSEAAAMLKVWGAY